MPEYNTDSVDATFRAVARELRAALGNMAYIEDAPASLEQLSRTDEAPRTISARALEGGAFDARPVLGEREPGFSAFLDGVQQSRVVTYIEGAPIVHGMAAAVVRVRRDRRLERWAHRVEQRLYAPQEHLPPAVWDRLARFSPIDSSTHGGDNQAPSRHPLATVDCALRKVQQHREDLEQRLAERWCGEGAGALYIDGGISGSERVAGAHSVVGVVKSHRTLYAVGDGLSVIFRLGAGERTTVFAIEPTRRAAVASWYLRLRDSTGRDPTFGLVRAEIALEPIAGLTERADAVSRWLLAERAPLALPDARWDRMAYGVRNSEQFLRAIT